MRRLLAAAFVAALGAAAASSLAEPGTAAFRIEVNLQRAVGASRLIPTGGAQRLDRGDPGCTSRTDGDASRALIQVLCAAGAFVTIEPAPGQGLALETAEAYRYDVGPAARTAAGTGAAEGFNPRQAEGTVTALQVSSAAWHGSALEMLVSF